LKVWQDCMGFTRFGERIWCWHGENMTRTINP
jgi:hypothetical protein